VCQQDCRNVPGARVGGVSGWQALERSAPVSITSPWIRTGLDQELEHGDVELARRMPECPPASSIVLVAPQRRSVAAISMLPRSMHHRSGESPSSPTTFGLAPAARSMRTASGWSRNRAISNGVASREGSSPSTLAPCLRRSITASSDPPCSSSLMAAWSASQPGQPTLAALGSAPRDSSAARWSKSWFARASKSSADTFSAPTSGGRGRSSVLPAPGNVQARS
jgi:hypothetical protein